MFLNTSATEWTAPPARPDGDPRAVQRSLPDFAPTPLLEAPGLARDLGVGRVFVKDEHVRAGLPSFKILGAAWAVFRMLGGTGSLADLKLDPDTTLVSATAGNHGRAVAYLARILGVGAHIFIPAGTAPARISAIRSEGAVVDVVDGDYSVAVAAATKRADNDPLAVHAADVGNSMSPIWASEGYTTIPLEIDEQLGELTPDLVVIPVGAGAFASSVVTHYRGAGARPKILAVEPDSAACLLKSLEAGELVSVPGPHPSVMAGLNAGDVDAHAWPVLRRGVDAALSISDADAHWAMRALATEGVIAGECGAASAAGLRALLATEGNPLSLTRDSVVVLISTEGVHDSTSYEKIISAA